MVTPEQNRSILLATQTPGMEIRDVVPVGIVAQSTRHRRIKQTTDAVLPIRTGGDDLNPLGLVRRTHRRCRHEIEA